MSTDELSRRQPTSRRPSHICLPPCPATGASRPAAKRASDSPARSGSYPPPHLALPPPTLDIPLLSSPTQQNHTAATETERICHSYLLYPVFASASRIHLESQTQAGSYHQISNYTVSSLLSSSATLHLKPPSQRNLVPVIDPLGPTQQATHIGLATTSSLCGPPAAYSFLRTASHRHHPNLWTLAALVDMINKPIRHNGPITDDVRRL